MRAHLTARRRPDFRAGDIIPVLAVTVPSVALIAIVLTLAVARQSSSPRQATDPLGRRIVALLGHADSIRLSPEQQRIADTVAGVVPMPCHRGKTLAARCCACNLGKSIAGVIKEQIAQKGADAEQAKKAALEWIQSVNPGGYSGGACPGGRCRRPFREDGCAGMKESDLVY